MDTFLLILISSAGFIIAYHTYGKFLSKKVFELVTGAPVPSREKQDGIDYVPSKRGIIFGHHFTSIAGTGPIVGPAIGIIWGWLPAILWIVLGSIFLGAVHDFGSLVVSMRNEGKSISEVAARYINPRVRFIFFVIVFLVLLIVIAIFGVVIAIVFDRFPAAVLPVWAQIPIAIALGYAVYKKQANVTLATTAAVVVMYLFVTLGAALEHVSPGMISIPDLPGLPATGSWTIVLLVYAFIASTLPVTTLLQPRDYTNAWQLFLMMALLAGGAVFASITGGLNIAAPAINHADTGAPPVWPFMFVTIACGAISGFHSLVASGTSPKQVSAEPDAQFIGYGSMLLEGALAVLVLVCVSAGIAMAYKTADGRLLSGTTAWQHHYQSWAGAAGMGPKLTAVVEGAANMMATIKIPHPVGVTLMGVFIASFAGTTLDTAVRIQRYVVSELTSDLKISALSNRWVATSIAVISAAALAFSAGANGKGAMILWPLFGATNQLLAALALLVVTMYLRKKHKWHYLLTAIPCLFMLIMTNWAMIIKEKSFITSTQLEGFQKWLLVAVAALIAILGWWMTAETVIVFCKKQNNH